MKHTTFSLLTAGLLLSLGGCSISYSPDGEGEQQNTCLSSADCGDGAVCQAGACISTHIDLHGLIVEVRPNSTASFGASTSFLLTPDDRLTQGIGPGGVQNHFDSKLPAPVDIDGANIKLGYADLCTSGVSAPYPSNITLERVTPFQGFHFDPITLASKPVDTPGVIQVPPGIYNVYVEPQQIPGCAEPPPPPILFVGQDLSQQSPTWLIPKPTQLTGDIQTAPSGVLKGWRLDIVEPAVGRVISKTQTLPDTQALSVAVAVDFSWPDKAVSPYIRLRPPDGVNMPSVYWGLVEALVGSSPAMPEVHLTVANLLVPPRDVEIQVQDHAEPPHNVPAEVKIRSQQLIQTTGKVTTSATFGLDLPPPVSGGFWEASVPPGNYRVRVTPLGDDSLATTEADFPVPQGTGCFCGHAIPVNTRAVLKGDVATIAGSPLVGAPIVVEPSQNTPVSFWNSVHALDPLLPRATNGVSDAVGGFEIKVDPGVSDVSVRPSEASGFAWLVKPRVLVQVSDTKVDLVGQRLPAPAILEGTFTDPSGSAVVSAYVHAWLPVQDATKITGLTGTVIQIASTTTDAQGHYKLVLPAAISQ